MEAKINVAAILYDKPQGTKLYFILSDGECFLNEASEDSIYIDIDNRKRFWCISAYGSTHSFPNGCVLLFPSKEMRDWSKFAWKKGDVLVCKDDNSHIIFEKFNDDTYATFTGKLYYQATKAGYSYAHTRNLVMTQDFDIEKGDAAGDEFDVYPFTDNNVCKQIAYIKYVHQLQHLLFGLGLNSEMEV